MIWNYLLDTMQLFINEQCPLKKFKISKVKEPWVTPELLEFIKDKDKVLKKTKKNKFT